MIKSEKSAYFRHVFANNFFLVHIEFWKKNFFLLLLALLQMRRKRLKNTENLYSSWSGALAAGSNMWEGGPWAGQRGRNVVLHRLLGGGVGGGGRGAGQPASSLQSLRSLSHPPHSGSRQGAAGGGNTAACPPSGPDNKLLFGWILALHFLPTYSVVFVKIQDFKANLGFPLSGVVYFDTIIFTLLTRVTVARKLRLYYHEMNDRLNLRHTFHFNDSFSLPDD
jgi:hypothetical protein